MATHISPSVSIAHQIPEPWIMPSLGTRMRCQVTDARSPTPGSIVLRRMPVTWHVGSCDPDHKGSDSLEGRGLSVSPCPQDWIAIARLGGNPIWRMDAKDDPATHQPGGWFIDAHASKAWLTQVAVRMGLLVHAIHYAAVSTDEDGEERYSLHETHQEAADELMSDDDVVRPRQVLAATDALHTALGRTRISAVVAAGLAYTEVLNQGDDRQWVLSSQRTAAVAPGTINGILWSDRYDPSALSAPRAVIPPDRVDLWGFRHAGMA